MKWEIFTVDCIFIIDKSVEIVEWSGEPYPKVRKKVLLFCRKSIMVHIEISSKDSFIGIYFCLVEKSI